MAAKKVVPITGVKTPAKGGKKDLLKDERRFYNILLDDYHFDAIQEYIGLYKKVSKSKRLKAYQRLPLMEKMLSKILDLCIPKIRAIDDKGLGNTGRVTFNLQIGSDQGTQHGAPPLKSAGSGKVKSNKTSKIQIPSVIDKDGNVSVSISS